MNYLQQLRDLISGKKTYLLAVAAIITALVGWAQGMISNIDLIKAIFAACATCTVRAAITKSGNGLTYLLIGALIAGWVFATPSAFAEGEAVSGQPSVVSQQGEAVSQPPFVVKALALATDYLAKNGEASSGIGGTLADLGHGKISPVVIQKLNFATLTLRHTEWKPGLVHTSTVNDLSHEGVGLALSVRAFKLDFLKQIHFLVFQDLSEILLSVGMSVDADRAIQGQFDSRHTVAFATLGWRF